MQKALTFYRTMIGKKIIMALSGIVLFGFVLGHMIGNLQVFLGPEAFNQYAVKLHETPLLLWGTRLVLAVSFVVHMVMALQLVKLSRSARPVDYRKKNRQKATFASLTMTFSGITLFFFLLYHLAHFTFPGVAMGAYEHQHYSSVYTNFVNGFSVPWVVALYVAAQITLGMHLYHGSYSLLQTMGINNPMRNDTLKQVAQFFALTVTVGNIILPLSVFLGLLS